MIASWTIAAAPRLFLLAALGLVAGAGFGARAQAAVAAPSSEELDRSAKSFRETLEALVAADTTNPPGNEARAVAILAKRLKAEKVPYEIVPFGNGRENLVARLKGNGSKKPLLLLAHIDVVGAENQNWSTPPHKVTEKDGFLYGRGVLDDLGMATANLEVFLMLKRSGASLSRDVILAYTGDEESGGGGIRDLLAKRPDLIDAEVALNEGGGLQLNGDGKPKLLALQAAEKTYVDFTLTANGPTGHSSIPKKGNAIDRIALALTKLASAPAEARLHPITRAYLRERAKLEEPKLAKAMLELASAKGRLPKPALAVLEAVPELSARLRTTCVTTMVSGGTRQNALPSQSTANVNCRILPDETIESVAARLKRLIADPGIEIKVTGEFGSAPASAIEGPIFEAIQRVTQEKYPGLPIIPVVQSGATDSRFLRAKGVQAFGLSPIGIDENDVSRAHGIDERIPVASIRPGLEYFYRLVTEIAEPR